MAKKGTTIALFGGSFDPPHLGHQLVISYLLGVGEVDGVWVVPTFKHALGKQLVDFKHRMNMCREMIRIFDTNRVAVIRAEYDLSLQPGFVDSRTINLVQYIYEEHPHTSFRFVIGSDLVDQFKTWDEHEEIERLAPPLVVGRLGYKSGNGMTLPNISSSAIKEGIKKGTLSELVPKHVANYINLHQLYGGTCTNPCCPLNEGHKEPCPPCGCDPW